MKRIRKFNEEFGIYARLWTIKESDIRDIFVDLIDISQVDLQFQYADPENHKYSVKFWNSVDLVDSPPPSENGFIFVPTIVYRSAFYEVEDLDKCLEYYQIILEIKDRLIEQYGEKNVKIYYRSIKASDEYIKNKKTCIGYNIYIFNG